MKNISKANQINTTAYLLFNNIYIRHSATPVAIKAAQALVLVTSLTPDTGDPMSQASPSRAGTRCWVLMVGGHGSYKGHMS